MDPPNMWWWLLRLILSVITDVVKGIFLCPLRSFNYDEVPQVSCCTTPFNDNFVKSCPDLRAYKPKAWLTGPHAQLLFFQSLAYPQRYKFTRSFVLLSDGVSAAVDLKSSPYLPIDAPLAVICHGLGGSSNNAIIIRMSEVFVSRGWRTAVYIRRGHDGLSLLPRSEEATLTLPVKGFPRHCDTGDMHDVSMFLRAEFPGAPMVAVGFSAGANVVVKYLGEYSRSSPYIAGVSVSNGYDVNDVTIELENNRRMSDDILLYYLKLMLFSRLSEVKHLAKVSNAEIDWEEVSSSKSVRSFEQALMVPLYGHADVKEFYMLNSSHEWLKHVKVPLLCMSNWDDPIIARHLPHHAIEASMSNPNIISIVTLRGGHLGWLEGVGQTWASTIIASFLKHVLQKQVKTLND